MINKKMNLVSINGIKYLYNPYRLGKIEINNLKDNGFFYAEVRTENGDLTTGVAEPRVAFDYTGFLVSTVPFEFGKEGFIDITDIGFCDNTEATPLELRQICQAVEKCRDCSYLIEFNGKWYCDDIQKYCKSLINCPCANER